MQAIRNEELELLKRKFDKKEKYKPNLAIRPNYFTKDIVSLGYFGGIEGNKQSPKKPLHPFKINLKSQKGQKMTKIKNFEKSFKNQP